jgi:hypothetical protein
MQVEHVLVEEIQPDTAKGTAELQTTLYEFGEERWISAHRGVEGQSIGPMTIVDTRHRAFETPTVVMHSFGRRPLPVEEKASRAISYTTVWQVDANTVYTVVLPVGYVADEISLDRRETDLPGDLQLAATDDGRLFYWTLLMGRSPEFFDVRARVLSDPDRASHLVARVDVVEGRSRFASLSRAVPSERLGSDFWLKLLDYGSRFFG